MSLSAHGLFGMRQVIFVERVGSVFVERVGSGDYAGRGAPQQKPQGKGSLRMVHILVQESGRPWKQVASRASGLRSPILSTSWEYKMREKAEQQAFRDQRRAAVTARKEAIQVRVARTGP